MSDYIDQTHLQIYNSNVWAYGNSKWLGYPILKYPCDLFLYQEILHEVQPDIIIECGTFNGGSAMFLCSILELIGKGKVLSIDIDPQPNLPTHERLSYLKASSTSMQALKAAREMITLEDTVLVILDSDHRKHHVLTELNLYYPLVTKGSYLIVEDTNINGHPVSPDFGPGPMEAVEDFLQSNTNFIIDEEKHKFLITFNPKGYLKRIK
ncbi:CmcI family methyltransferase [Priestia taiwanensis]|uniref:Cephalosporin hydroxylase n=1 Tax=Priestia taiwanensis TaxID=1347902 RepID=A0A917AT78_9BACI|nr:CmcI family methyltransferase [Priestia taiwanensis]MBM7363217.1 cephalosporin hydroxylase [Priestia taiwanensis]GGE68610.1 cephalosporin hydroxylase [Priestia taiwanensis]